LRNLVPGASLLIGLVLLLGIFCAGITGSAWLQSEFLKILVFLAGMYVAASFSAAFLVGRWGGWRYIPIMPVVFATYHFSYALGFLLAFIFRPMGWDRPTYLQKLLTAITR
jgi:hypothetical protein